MNLAAIGLGDVDYAKAFREETGITFPLLIDAEKKAYRAAELRRRISCIYCAATMPPLASGQRPAAFSKKSWARIRFS